MTHTDLTTRDAVDVARRFIDALDARDRKALVALVAEDAEFRKHDGGVLRGHDGARALVDAAEDVDLRLTAVGTPDLGERDGRVVVRWPVRERVRASAELERVAQFELRDGRITAFTTQALTP